MYHGVAISQVPPTYALEQLLRRALALHLAMHGCTVTSAVYSNCIMRAACFLMAIMACCWFYLLSSFVIIVWVGAPAAIMLLDIFARRTMAVQAQLLILLV
jgi:hypothetical protein